MDSKQDVLDLVLIDPTRKVRIAVTLRNSDGDAVSISEIASKLADYMDQKLVDEEPNQINRNILPFLTQILAEGLPKTFGYDITGVLLSQDTLRRCITTAMLLAFGANQFIQQNKLTVSTTETPLSDREVKTLLTSRKIEYLIQYSTAAGLDPVESIKTAILAGQLNREDLSVFGISEDVLDKLFTTNSDTTESN